MKYGITVRTALPFAEAAARIRDALQEQGFGVLTEIDVRAMLREKIGAEPDLGQQFLARLGDVVVGVQEVGRGVNVVIGTVEG